MSRESLPCPPQMRNGGSPPAHLSSSTAVALGESRWLYPPQHAPNALRPLFSDFLAAQCEQIETDFCRHQDEAARAKAVADELVVLNKERRRHAASLQATVSAAISHTDFLAAQCEQIEKDFYRHREEAELDNN